ncbi:MAG: nicotinate (nicotinamide) nucleotide adenylyltransferase [Elusimicrobiaceae bacterium]|nr:nicotinate (nicotinamide) nucleotide adenylyltransferase [Elusimicrobiaceae bacterium]
MKILVFGGSFDPVHKGHVAMLKKALAVIKPDVTHIVPAYQSPFKAKSPTPFHLRMQMAQAAFSALDTNLIFDDYEFKQGGKTYSYQLVQYLQTRYPQADIYLLVGTDCLNDLHAWKNADYIFKHTTIVAGRRKGFKENHVDFKHIMLPGQFPKLSSTRVRTHILSSGGIPADKISAEVGKIILAHDLYGLEQHRWLKKHLKPNRYLHSIKVAELCAVLSDIYEVPTEKAVQAGILHDAGKGFSAQDLIHYCTEHRLKIPYFEDICKCEPALLHSFVSAQLAQELFSIQDRDVLTAIEEHTLGSLNMTQLSKILFVADISSKDRKYKDAFVIRTLAMQDLEKALLYAANRKLWFTIDSQKWLCPAGIELWNHLVKHAA